MAHDPRPSSTPESILLDHLAGLEASSKPDLEALCAAHPEHADELRRLGSWDLAGEGALPRGSVFGPRHARAAAEPGHDAAHAGDVLGDFRLVHPLASGGMGQVWVAEQVSLGRRVALKLVRPERLSPRTLELFAREARAGGRLTHPGIVSVLDHGESDGVAWIAMELVEDAWTLRDAIDQIAESGELPRGYYEHVARFVTCLADALHAAHEAGVIHRDLKPQNVLVTPDDQPKLTDFGLARITDESALSVTGEFAGTYYYMSPEQVAARRTGIDHRTDVFSLGIVLYEMLTLQRPFQGDTTHQVAKQILLEDPPSPRTLRSRIPRDLAAICGKCLEKDRDRRYPTMGQVAADLRRHLAHEPILAKPPTALQRTVKWARRNPTKSVASGLAVVALSVISVLAVKNTTLAEERAEQAQLALQQRESAREQERIAREQAALAEQKEADVLRLSAQQDLEDLLEEQAVLWPPHPEQLPAYRSWIERAQSLVAELPLYETQREALRALALPRTAEERMAERESHPEFEVLGLQSAKLESQRRALAVRRGEAEVSLGPVDRSELPEDSSEWHRIAWERVIPDRKVFGEEARGLSIGLEALERIGEEGRAGLLDTIAWGWFALGDDEEALAASWSALEAAPEADRAGFEERLTRLSEAVEEARSEEGLALAAEALSALEAEVESLEARVDERREWRFPAGEEESRWWNASLTKLTADLEALERDLLAPEAVTREKGWSVSRRAAFAARLEAGFATGGEFDVRWERDLPAIAEAYPGLDLVTQMGLVPIGPDPESGLWEFAHLATGEPAVRGEDGRLVLTEETGVVLVLIPAGSFWMGAQAADPGGRHYDPEANTHESPVHEVWLSAHFLSKYELTQGQWRRLRAFIPSSYGPHRWAARWSRDPSTALLLHPVGRVSWLRCMEVLPQVGLSLPSEAQWEYGARAGTDTKYWCGDSVASLDGVANVLDRYAMNQGAPWQGAETTLDDGNMVHGRVGSYRANGFGLHDVHGNVTEWCLDGYDEDFYALAPSHDPVSDPGAWEGRVQRGGGFHNPARYTRSAERVHLPPGSECGVRPGRAITD